MTSHLLRRLAASALSVACFSAIGAPVTYAPGVDSGWMNVTVNAADITSAQGIYIFATMTNLADGDRVFAAFSSGLNGTGDATEWRSYIGVDTTASIFSIPASADFLDGNFSVKFGTDATSGSSMTFDKVQVKFYNSTTGWLDTVASLQPAVDTPRNLPEPATLVLASSALAGLAVSRRRKA